MRRTTMILMAVLFSATLLVSLNAAFAGWTKQQVTDNSTEDIRPVVAIDGDGKVHIAWQGNDGSDDEIYYSNNVSGSFSSPVNVSDNSVDDSNASLALDSSGKTHIAWNRDSGSSSEIYYSNNVGGSFSSPVNVSNNSVTENSVSIAVDANEKAHIAWDTNHSGNPSGGYEVYYNNNVGGSFGSPTNVSDLGEDNHNPSIAMDSNGKVHISWGGPGASMEIYYSNNSSGSFSSPLQLTSTGATDILSSIAIDGNDKVHIDWCSSGEIYYINNVGGAFGSSTKVGNSTWNSASTIAIDGNGKVHIGWKGNDGNDDEIYYSNNIAGSFNSSVNVTNNDASDGANQSWCDRSIGLHNAGNTVWVAYSSQEGSSDYEIWMASTTDYPLPVELSFFTAQAGDGEVALQWSTESETENLGFHVCRALEEDGSYERLTSELIQGAGNTSTQQTYSFTNSRLTNGVTYWYKLEDVAFDGTRTMHGPVSVIPQAKAEIVSAPVPDSYALSQNYPNPFNASTVIRVQLPEASEVRLSVYTLLGQEVRRLVDAKMEAGWHSVLWDGRDRSGRDAASGMYLCRLRAGDFVQTRKIVLLR